MRGRKWSVFAAAWVAVLGAAAPAVAQGGVDRSFGVDGVVHLDPEVPSEQMRVDPEGRIYLLGRAYRCSTTCSSERSLLRLSPDGSRDLEFGEGGIVHLPEWAGGPSLSVLAVDAKGRPLAVITAPNKVVLTRLEPDGSIDSSFGRGGVRTFTCSCEEPAAMVQFDRLGRILVVVSHVTYVRSTYTPTTISVFRLHPDGSRDARFGRAKATFEHRSSPSVALVRGDGSLVLSGSEGSRTGFYLMRFKADGTRDRRFDRASRRALAPLRLAGKGLFQFAWISGFVSRSRGTIDAFGARPGGGFVLRLRSNGTLNPRFAKKGVRRFGWRVEDTVAVGAGRVFAVGRQADRPRRAAFLLTPAGTFDRSFNEGRPLILHVDQLAGLASQRGQPLLFDTGLTGCRYSCTARPKLIRFTVGPFSEG